MSTARRSASHGTIRRAIIALLCAAGGGVAAPAVALTHCEVAEIRWIATGQNFDPSQTHTPGGAARPVSEDRAEVHWWPQVRQAQLRWEVRTHYPFSATFRYLEQLTVNGGVVTGRDGFRSAEGAVSPARRAARFSDLWLRVPLFWRGRSAGSSREISLAGARWTLSVARDQTSDAAGGVPLVASARQLDWPRGDVPHEIAYSGWREVAGLSMPTRIEQRQGGQLLRRERLTDIAVTPVETVDPDCAPPARPKSAEAPVWIRAAGHWVTRRLAMGAGADRDPTGNVAFEERADGVFHVVGGSHHALVVVDDRGLTLVDAPLHPARSEALLRMLDERWPDRPLRRVVVTHHHSDHSGGLMPLLRTGAELVVGREAEGFFRDVIARGRDLGDVPVRTISGRERIATDARALTVINVPNDHAAGMLAVRVDDAALTFVADLYSPGREAQSPQLARQFYSALSWHGLASGDLIGSHGSGTQPVGALRAYLAEQFPDWMVPAPDGARPDARTADPDGPS